jgi:uncharacterized protein (TIGR03083 family)
MLMLWAPKSLTGWTQIGQAGVMSSARSEDDRWPTTSGVEVAELFKVERMRLLALLGELAPTAWELLTPCPGWDVRSLCSHLLGDDLAWLAHHRDSHHGTPSPPLDEHGFVAWLDALQDDWVQAARRLSPRLIMDLLRWTLPQILEVFAGQDPSAVAASVAWAGPGPVPVWLDQLRELSEQWIHRQQLLQALDRASDLRSDIAGPVLDGLRWAYPFRLSTMSAEAGQVVDIIVEGPVTRAWRLVDVGHGWRFAGDVERPAAATVNMTTEQAWRLLTNNLPAAEHDTIAARGDPALLAVIRKTRAIIGLPQ